MRDVMKTLLIALGLTAAAATLATPAHAYYLRDCLRGAPCPGFYAQSPRYYVPPRRYYGPSPYYAPRPRYSRDTMVHRPTMLRARDTTTTTRCQQLSSPSRLLR